MALTIVYGVADGPVMNYAGTDLIVLESPNPHPPGTNVEINSSNDSLVSTAAEITLTAVTTPGTFHWYGDIFMVHAAGFTNLSFVFSWGTGVRFATPQTGYALGEVRRIIEGNVIGGSGGIIGFNNSTGGVTSGSLAQPWYRYRLRVYLFGSAYYASSDAWIKLSISLS